jgi:hypothetical protein
MRFRRMFLWLKGSAFRHYRANWRLPLSTAILQRMGYDYGSSNFPCRLPLAGIAAYPSNFFANSLSAELWRKTVKTNLNPLTVTNAK